MQLLYTRNVSRGGLFVGTRRDLPEGTAVRVSVIHPTTREHFVLEAVVRWRARSTEPGIGLEFVKLTEQRRDEFLEFIRSEIPVEEILFVSDDHRHGAGPAPQAEPMAVPAPAAASASRR
jgi:uncharacterized protein (TIGR02266 family)